MIDELSDLFYTDSKSLTLAFKANKVNIKKLYKLVKSPDLIDRRDEFYSLFKRESTADSYWTRIWENPAIKW